MNRFSICSLRVLALMIGALALGGCATFSEDGGFGAVETVAKERLNKDVIWARDDGARSSVQGRVRELLKQPLSVDGAIQVALLNNRGLQASYAELGIAEADLVRAGRFPNPGLSYSRISGGGGVEIERGLSFNLIEFVALPVARRIEGRRFEQTKLSVAGEMLALAAETRKAYFRTLAARETVTYLEQVKVAAEASAELANRMRQAGNWSVLDQAREQLFYAEATAQLARARQATVAERERLTRLLGLIGADAEFPLPERMPDLPADPREVLDVEQTALAQRLDVQMAKGEAEAMAQSLGLTRTTRFINVLEVGYLNKSESGEARRNGYEVRFELPLFDFGSARVAKAEALYMQTFNRAAEIAVNARSEAREAYNGYRTAYDLAKHYRDEIVPLRKRISEENRLRYTGSLISVFELLADAREQVTTVNRYIETLRDFWLAETALEMTLTGKSPGRMSARDMSMSMPAETAGNAH